MSKLDQIKKKLEDLSSDDAEQKLEDLLNVTQGSTLNVNNPEEGRHFQTTVLWYSDVTGLLILRVDPSNWSEGQRIEVGEDPRETRFAGDRVAATGQIDTVDHKNNLAIANVQSK